MAAIEAARAGQEARMERQEARKQELLAERIRVAAMQKAKGLDAKQLKAEGFDAEQLKGAGFSGEELRAAGFNDQQLKAAGFDILLMDEDRRSTAKAAFEAGRQAHKEKVEAMKKQKAEKMA